MSKQTGGPAFPSKKLKEIAGIEGYVFAPGMTLRDYFAAKAMQGMLHWQARNESNAIAVSRWSYEMADAMLAQRENKA